MIKVIDYKASEWLNSNMAKYLRPSTLFGDKFERYLSEAEEQEKAEEVARTKPLRFTSFDPEAALRAAYDKSYGGLGNGT
jgi:hypothetical protein